MTLVAFGITGDLMRLKILPALEGLYKAGAMPAGTRIIGVSRKPWSDGELRSYLQQVLPEAELPFLDLFTFLQGDAADAATYAALAEALGSDDALLYLSLAPSLYETVFTHLRDAGFATRTGTTRVMIEKPFGLDGASAEKLYAQLRNVVAEENIYLVDHYLAKDWVRELKAPHGVKSIAVRFLETVGVEERGALYDQLGALRDVVQNHALQLLAHLVAPGARAEFLERLPPFTAATRAQYEGYRSIRGVAPGSNTETYCSVCTTLDTSGFEGVTVTLEAGKRLPHSVKEIVLTLEDGSTATLSERPNSVSEYELLLRAALAGDHTLFPSVREVLAQWRFIDPIEAAWAAGAPELLPYAPGTMPDAS
jgi:glucose-6-phosphate 1-dehydrogenase